KLHLTLLSRIKIWLSPALSRAVGDVLARKAAAEPGRLTLESVKRLRPAEPAYCNAAVVFLKTSRSSDTSQKKILGLLMSLLMARTTCPGKAAVPVVPPSSGPKLLVVSGMFPMTCAPVGLVVNCDAIAKSELVWKKGDTVLRVLSEG